MDKIKLSDRELAVMAVLWNSESPLAAADIPQKNPALNFNTVRSALNNLLKKEYIQVADIVYHGTVLTRTYKPVLTQENYLSEHLKYFKKSSFIATLVKAEKDESALDALEKLIQEQKKELRSNHD